MACGNRSLFILLEKHIISYCCGPRKISLPRIRAPLLTPPKGLGLPAPPRYRTNERIYFVFPTEIVALEPAILSRTRGQYLLTLVYLTLIVEYFQDFVLMPSANILTDQFPPRCRTFFSLICAQISYISRSNPINQHKCLIYGARKSAVCALSQSDVCTGLFKTNFLHSPSPSSCTGHKHLLRNVLFCTP